MSSASSTFVLMAMDRMPSATGRIAYTEPRASGRAANLKMLLS